jgi:DNA-directed RNA polymerase specialized sigma subunit
MEPIPHDGRPSIGDDEARAMPRLVEAFRPIISSHALRLAGASGEEPVRFVQAGLTGLLRAVARYDPEAGTPFEAFAFWWIHRSMRQVEVDGGDPRLRG